MIKVQTITTESMRLKKGAEDHDIAINKIITDNIGYKVNIISANSFYIESKHTFCLTTTIQITY